MKLSDKAYASMLISLVKNTTDSIYFKKYEEDKGFIFVMVSDAKASNWNVNFKDMNGKTDFDFMSLEDAEKAYHDDFQVFSLGAEIRDKLEKTIRKNGQATYLSVSKSPWIDENGKIIGIIGISRDVTKRIEAENYIKDMRGILAHDVLEPLFIINSELKKLVKRQYQKAQDFIDSLQKIVSRAIILESTIRNCLFEFSYADSGDIRKEAVILKSIIGDVVKEVEYELVKNGTIIDLNDSIESLSSVRANKEALKAIFRNLVRNAIKYGGVGCKIRFRGEDYGGHLKVGVFNSGPSIPDLDTEKIFDKFESQGGSTGLGLSISRKLIELHGGRIWCENILGEDKNFHPEFMFTLKKK